MPERSVHVADDLESLSQQLCDRFVDLVRQRVAEQGVCRIALSGGSGPRVLYRLLAQRDLPWPQVHWYWGDERNVPQDHEDSNFRMAHQLMLSPAGAPAETVFPVPVDPSDPAGTAAAYERTLRREFEGQSFPRWDLALQGMGDDGHTASLFPDTTALEQIDRWYVENWVPKLNCYRLTLTVPAINSARNVWFLIGGHGKREALRQVWSGLRNTARYPSQLIRPTAGDLQWFVTADACPESD